MWVFTKHGLLSIVEHRNDKDFLCVRARQAHHLTKNFPNTVPMYTPDADYHWRLVLSRNVVRKKMIELVDLIDYPNFKDAADEDLQGPYLRVWTAGMGLQGVSNARITAVDFSQGESSGSFDPY